MKTPLTVLVCALTLTACADHAARARLGIQDPTLLQSGIGASQDEAAGAPSPQWVSAYAPAASGVRGARVVASAAEPLCRLNRTAISARRRNAGSARGPRRRGKRATIGVSSGEPSVRRRSSPWAWKMARRLSAANPALRTVSVVRPESRGRSSIPSSRTGAASCRRGDNRRSRALKSSSCKPAMMHGYATSLMPEKRLPDIQDNLRKSARRVRWQCKPGAPRALRRRECGNAANSHAARRLAVPFRRRQRCRDAERRQARARQSGAKHEDRTATLRELENHPATPTVSATPPRNQSLSLQRAKR